MINTYDNAIKNNNKRKEFENYIGRAVEYFQR